MTFRLLLATLFLASCAPVSATPAPATPVPTVAPPTQPVPTPSPAPAAEHPAGILDLTRWKVTLPLNAESQLAGRATEVLQPLLATFTHPAYFAVHGNAVRFRAPVNGATTSGSSYPRSELREMNPGGLTQAAWSTESGTHTMVIEQAIAAVPAAKRHVVAGQIHDGSDDVVTIRLEHPRLFVDHNGRPGNTLTSTYTLGTRFTVRIEATGGQIRVFYNGSPTPADTLARAGGSMYFKAGAYTQSNCTRETRCAEDNFGEVLIYRLEVSHE